MNFMFFASVLGLAFFVSVVVGAILHSWQQRKKANVPGSMNFVGGSVILIALVAVCVFALPNIITAIGGAAQAAFPGADPKIPNYSEILKDGANGDVPTLRNDKGSEKDTSEGR